jgi:hypothetical protein
MSGLAYADRVQETTAVSGTGTATLLGAVTGSQTFSSAFATGAQVPYCITDGTNWEVGIGTYTTSGNTLSRDVVASSSNAGALVSFTGATSNVFCTLPADTLADIGLAMAFAAHQVAV